MRLIKITFLISFISSLISCVNSSEGKGDEGQAVEIVKIDSLASASEIDSIKTYQVYPPANLAYYKTLYLQKRFLGKPLDSLSNYLGEYVNYTALKKQKERKKEDYLRVRFANFTYAVLVDTADYTIKNVSGSGWWIGLPKDTTQHLRYLCNTTVSKDKFDEIFSESLFGERDTLEPLAPFDGCLLYYKKKEATIWVEDFNDSVKIKRMICGSRRSLPHFYKPDSLKERLLMPYVSYVKPSEYIYCHDTYYPHLKKGNEPHQFKELPSQFSDFKSHDTIVLLEGDYCVNQNEFENIPSLKDLNNVLLKGAFPADRSHLVSTNRHNDVLHIENSKDLIIENLIIGHYSPGEGDGRSISINNSSNILIKNCVIYGPAMIGLYLNNCKNIILDNVKIYDCEQAGVFAERSDVVEIRNSVLYDNKYIHFTSWGSKNVSTYNTHFIKRRKADYSAALSTSFPEDINDSSYYIHADECKFIGFTPKDFALGEESEGDDTLGMHFIKTKNCQFEDFPQYSEVCGH